MAAFPCLMECVKTSLVNHCIRMFGYPGNGLYLNPIEYLWEDKEIEISQIQCTNEIELIEQLTRVWNKNPDFRERAHRCIRGQGVAKGGYFVF